LLIAYPIYIDTLWQRYEFTAHVDARFGTVQLGDIHGEIDNSGRFDTFMEDGSKNEAPRIRAERGNVFFRDSH
jgi:hypothetical protein